LDCGKQPQGRLGIAHVAETIVRPQSRCGPASPDVLRPSSTNSAIKIAIDTGSIPGIDRRKFALAANHFVYAIKLSIDERDLDVEHILKITIHALDIGSYMTVTKYRSRSVTEGWRRRLKRWP